MKSNILLKILGGVAVFILIVLIVVGKRSGQEVKAVPQASHNFEGFDESNMPVSKSDQLANLVAIEHGPQQIHNGLEVDPIDHESLEAEYGVDVDSPLETMRTLTNETRLVREDSLELQKKLEKVQSDSKRLLEMEDSINKRVERRFAKESKAADKKRRELEHTQSLMQQYVERLEEKLKVLSLSNESEDKSRPSAFGYDIDGAGIPSGLGYDENGRQINFDQMVWMNPMDAKQEENSSNVLTLPNFSKNVSNNLPELARGPVSKKNKEKDRLVKAYTINADATLIGSVAMTALVGRIPTGGQVEDPYPFKIIVGEENLSSNGINIPGVTGIKMTGLAKGDWTLSCVSGQIQSMTFTFQDGTIRTIPEPGSRSGEPLAWLSDEFGIPCITGQRITNAVSFLGSRIALAAAESYTSAEAASQLTTTSDGEKTTSRLTGDPKIFAKNTAISEGLSEAGTWLEERQQNSFDAIYAPPGTSVVIHITTELQIDYDPEGRKVNHYAKINSSSKYYLD